MAIGIARLAAGSIGKNAVKSINNTVIGQIYTDGEADIRAVVKDLSARQLANELIAASILSKLSLPAPRSFLVFAEPSDSFGSAQVPHESGLNIYFGSELSPHKPFYSAFNLDAALAFSALISFPGWGTILAFDEWIANIDRHLNNFLFDGSNIYLFDHDRCLTGPSWTPSDLIATASHECHDLVTMLHAAMSADSRRAAKALADSFSQLAMGIDVDEAIIESYAIEVKNGVSADIPAANKFLKDRRPIISHLCEQRLVAGGPF